MSTKGNDNDSEKKEHDEKAHGEDEDLLWFSGEVDTESAKDFVEKLFKASEKDAKKPLVVYIDSPGGELYALNTILAGIDAVPNKVITVAMGAAMSAASVILSHGDIRYVAPFSTVMIHEASGGFHGNVKDAKIDVKEMERLNEMFLGVLAKNMGITYKALQKMFTNRRRDMYLTPQEAVTLKIADKVGVPKVKKVVRYEID